MHDLNSILVSRSQRARWWNAAAVVGGGVVLTVFLVLLGWGRLAVAVCLIAAVLTFLMALNRQSSRRMVHHWEAQDRLVRHGQVIIYWRPGCVHCARLRLRLGGLATRANWVDIWEDQEAAAFVRDVNGGAETVPTVILSDGEARTNPDADLVRAELSRMSGAAA